MRSVFEKCGPSIGRNATERIKDRYFIGLLLDSDVGFTATGDVVEPTGADNFVLASRVSNPSWPDLRLG